MSKAMLQAELCSSRPSHEGTAVRIDVPAAKSRRSLRKYLHFVNSWMYLRRRDRFAGPVQESPCDLQWADLLQQQIAADLPGPDEVQPLPKTGLS